MSSRAQQGICISLLVASALGAQQSDIGPAPGRMVDVGGRHMHLLCSGSGSPIVVMEAGGSSYAIDFSLVQPEIARGGRVCSYDRAGTGWSERADSTNRRPIPRDLHELLTRAGEKPPYVLVGASMGGMYVREFHALYPTEVVGMVLIDPSSEDRLFTYYNGEARAIGTLTAEELKATVPQHTVAVPKRKPQTGAPFDKLPAELYATRIKLDERAIAALPDSVPPAIILRSAEADRARFARLLDARKANPRSLGDIPLVVLTRDEGWSEGLHEAHSALAALSSSSRHSRVTGSGHEVHLFVPAAVIQAVNDVRKGARPP